MLWKPKHSIFNYTRESYWYSSFSNFFLSFLPFIPKSSKFEVLFKFSFPFIKSGIFYVNISYYILFLLIPTPITQDWVWHPVLFCWISLTNIFLYTYSTYFFPYSCPFNRDFQTSLNKAHLWSHEILLGFPLGKQLNTAAVHRMKNEAWGGMHPSKLLSHG